MVETSEFFENSEVCDQLIVMGSGTEPPVTAVSGACVGLAELAFVRLQAEIDEEKRNKITSSRIVFDDMVYNCHHDQGFLLFALFGGSIDS